MAIDVEKSHVAVQALTDLIGQPTHGQHIPRPIERKAILGAQTLPGEDSVGNRLKARVVGAETVAGAGSVCFSLHN